MRKKKKAEEAIPNPEDDGVVNADTKVGQVSDSALTAAAAKVEDVDQAVGAEAENDAAKADVEETLADDDKTVADSEAGDADDAGAADAGASDAGAADAGAADAGADEAGAEDADAADAAASSAKEKRRIQWSRVVAFGLLPALALVLALGAGYLKWQDNSVRDGEIAAATSVRAAKDTTIAMLSYQPETVQEQLEAARDLLTGEFRESYTALTDDVVIPGAKEKQIAAVASVPAAASVSATPTEAVVLLFVNQTVSVGQDPPTDTASRLQVTLEKVGDRWLISKFDPV